MKGQGKTNRTATNGSVKCKSRLLASSSSNTKCKLRSRKAIHRKSRKPANLPCSMNECHTVEENGDDEQEQNGAGTAADSSADADANVNVDVDAGAGVGGTNGGGRAAVKTVETALQGDTQPRMSENLTEVAADVNEARKQVEAGDDSDTRAGGDDDASSSSELSDSADDEGVVGGDGRAKGAKDGRQKKDDKKQRVRHIHPCICDLSTKAQARIKAHIRERELFEMRHTKRLESIDAELRAIEDEIARRQQEEEEQQELYADKYEMVGKKKKRMKRSARRASMVSLGVKQVINWKKSPRIKVRHNQVSSLRKNFTAYCGDRPIPLREIKKIGFEQSPKIPVRITKAASVRGEFNAKKRQFLIDNEDKKPPFNLAPYW